MVRTGQNQVKWGMVLSYFLIILNTLYGLLITPYMITCLGEVEYGVYKTVASLTSALMVLDLGIGGTVMRYVAKYRADDEQDKISNFVAMNLIQAVVLCGVIAVVASVVYQTIQPVYGDTFTQLQIRKAQKLFVILVVNMLLHVFENVINGVITGYNRFFFGNGIKVIRLLLRAMLIVVILRVHANAVVLVLIDLTITLLFLLIELVYMRMSLRVAVKLVKWEKSVFWESGKYTGLMFLTSIASQVNGNLDNVMIGAISGPDLVTIYSMGLLIFGMYMNLSTAASGVLLPTVSNLLSKENARDEITNLIIRTGRIQFMIMGAAAVGFICMGKDFIFLWLGNGFEDVYWITLILIIPATLELCVNTCLAVLRAQNRLGFRTMVLFGATILNAVITYYAVRYWSYIGAAFGTAASFIFGSVIVMNIYFTQKIGLPMISIYREIFRRTWLCLLAAGCALWTFVHFFEGGVLMFVAGVVVFAIVYGVAMLVYGFSAAEKQFLHLGGRKDD